MIPILRESGTCSSFVIALQTCRIQSRGIGPHMFCLHPGGLTKFKLLQPPQTRSLPFLGVSFVTSGNVERAGVTQLGICSGCITCRPMKGLPIAVTAYCTLAEGYLPYAFSRGPPGSCCTFEPASVSHRRLQRMPSNRGEFSRWLDRSAHIERHRVWECVKSLK